MKIWKIELQTETGYIRVYSKLSLSNNVKWIALLVKTYSWELLSIT